MQHAPRIPASSRTWTLLLIIACALCVAACDSPSDEELDGLIYDPCAPTTETSTYTYDAQGQFAKIERVLMNGVVETKTFTDGRITSYALGSLTEPHPSGQPPIAATWTYDAQNRISTIEVDDRNAAPWSVAFAYDAQNNLSRLTFQGTITNAIAQKLGSNESTEATFLGVGASLIDGLDLKQTEAVPRVAFTNTVVNYTYNANNQFTESTWDYDGNGTIDATRRDHTDNITLTITTDVYYDAKAEVLGYKITHLRDPDGAITSTTSQILVGLDSQGRWSTTPLQNPITSTKTWTRMATPTALQPDTMKSANPYPSSARPPTSPASAATTTNLA